MSVRLSVNFFLLLHLLRDHWSDYFELEEFRWNLAYEFLSVSRCVHMKTIPWKQFLSVNKYDQTAAIFKITICPLLHLVTASPLRPLDFFKACPRCSPSGLVVHARSVDQYGHQQSSLFFTHITSTLEELCRNLAYEFLSMPRCVRLKTILVCQNIWPNGSHLYNR